MNPPLVKALLALILASALFVWSVWVSSKNGSRGPLLQLLGTGCLLVVILTHVFEALHLFPIMRWGEPHSIGHYLDLSSAVLAIVLLPASHFVRKRRKQPRPGRFSIRGCWVVNLRPRLKKCANWSP